MHPRWLYRPTDKPNPAVWDLCAEGRVFQADAIAAALADGWFLHPNDFPPQPDIEPDTEAPKRRGRPPKEG